MPVFWFGILLLIMFSLRFDLFPLIGGGDMTTVLDMLTSGEFVAYPEDFLAAVVDVPSLQPRNPKRIQAPFDPEYGEFAVHYTYNYPEMLKILD